MEGEIVCSKDRETVREIERFGAKSRQNEKESEMEDDGEREICNWSETEKQSIGVERAHQRNILYSQPCFPERVHIN